MFENSYNNRIVEYETLHNISVHDFERLSKAVSPKDNDKILDAGCGYGAVTRELLKQNRNFYAYLLDNSDTQINRAITFFANSYEQDFVKQRLKFFHNSILKTSFEDKIFDSVVCKMLLHEIEQDKQSYAIKEIYRILKKNGKLVIWDVLLDEKNAYFFREIIKAKDRIADWKSLVEKRYFFTEDQIREVLEQAGYRGIQKVLDIPYRFSTLSRFECEFLGDTNRYNEWVDYIRHLAELCDKVFLESISYCDTNDDVTFILPKGILIAIK